MKDLLALDRKIMKHLKTKLLGPGPKTESVGSFRFEGAVLCNNKKSKFYMMVGKKLGVRKHRRTGFMLGQVQ